MSAIVSSLLVPLVAAASDADGGEEAGDGGRCADGDVDVDGRRAFAAEDFARPDSARSDGLDTLGGLVINRLGYIPKAGTTLELSGGLRLTIQRATRRRVESIIIERGAPRT